MNDAKPANDAGDPCALFERWIVDAGGWESIDAIAMSLATATANGRPSVRMVLLRGFDRSGLRFYTSYTSRKAREIEENPYAAGLLYWPKLGRQVRVEGNIAMLSAEESDSYFAARPRGHQIAAWSSEQSEPVESHDVLETRFEHFELRFAGQPVARPHSWGGFRLVPRRFEFWQNQPNRMHDRVEYTSDSASEWQIRRLQP